MFSKVGNSRSGRTAVVPPLLGTQIQLRVGGRRVLGLHFPSAHLLLSRKGRLSPGQGQNLAWFRVTIFVERSAQEGSQLNPCGLSRYRISMENSRCLCYMTDCHGPLGGVSWLHVPEQVELDKDLDLFLPFNSETPQGLRLLNLTSSSV